MNPPTMAGWNLALRFGLEMAALAGLAFAAWHYTSGALRWGAVIVVPLVGKLLPAFGGTDIAGEDVLIIP